MATVPQKTLNWLWGVLQKEYRDPQRTYSDLAQTLGQYPGFAPRTDVYTYENGVAALLLHLNGTVPVNFRGTQYRFPVAIWMPHAYPRESPIFYVTPTDDMIIRPGQHVSPSDGRIYHPYLARWTEAWERSSVVDFLRILADIFAREPPVMARPNNQAQAQARFASQPQPPPRPPLPSVQQPPSIGSPGLASGPPPPPPPPKSSNYIDGPRQEGISRSDSQRFSRYDGPPSLPAPADAAAGTPILGSPPPQAPYQPQGRSVSRQSYHGPQQHPPSAVYQPQRQSIAGPPTIFHAQQLVPQQGARLPQHLQGTNLQSYPPSTSQQAPQQPVFQHQSQQQVPYLPQPLPPSSAPIAKPRQPNLMDESPFDVSLPVSSANIPTPTIPPNPEKQHILQTLQTTLLSSLHNQITQSSSAIAPLQAQNIALQAAHHTLQQELAQLQAQHSQLQQNITSLNFTIAAADRTIDNARNESSPSKVPNIDDLIIPPTVVARQLYDNVAEQRGYEAAIYALTEGFVRGRMSYDIWVRKARECAREEFRRKWLVRRVGRGMGLEMEN